MADLQEAAMPAFGDPPTESVSLPTGRKKRGRHHVRWWRVPLLAGIGVTAFFMVWFLYAEYGAEAYSGFIEPQIPLLPYVIGERQIPNDVPGMLTGVDITDSWYGYEPTKYTLYIPPDRAADEPLPLIVCLHGVGDESGKYITQGLASAVRDKVKSGGHFPMAAFFPTAHKGQWTPDSKGAEDALRLIDLIMIRHRIDPNRIYLTGWSSGGDGVWRLAEAYPERWAAIVPLCSTPTADPDRIRSVPCWAFAGGKDRNVSVWDVDRYVTDMWMAGGDAKCTVYPKFQHNVWTEAYNEPELYEWLSRKKKP